MIIIICVGTLIVIPMLKLLYIYSYRYYTMCSIIYNINCCYRYNIASRYRIQNVKLVGCYVAMHNIVMGSYVHKTNISKFLAFLFIFKFLTCMNV